MPLRENTDDHLRPLWRQYLKIFFCDYPHCQLVLGRFKSEDGVTYVWRAKLEPLKHHLNEWRKNSHDQLRGTELERLLNDLATWYRRHNGQVWEITFLADDTFLASTHHDKGRWWPELQWPKEPKE